MSPGNAYETISWANRLKTMAAMKVGGVLTDLLDVDVDVSKCDQDDCSNRKTDPESDKDGKKQQRYGNEVSEVESAGQSQKNELQVPVEVIITENNSSSINMQKNLKKKSEDCAEPQSRKLRRLESLSNKPVNVLNVVVPQIAVPMMVNVPIGYIIMKPQPTTISPNPDLCEQRVQDMRPVNCKWIDPGASNPCGQLVTAHQELVTHIWGHIKASNSANNVCLWEKCERMKMPFKNCSNLILHMNVHAGKKILYCPHSGCEKSFDDPCALRTHQRIHNEYTFPCTEPGCEEIFFSITTRRNHIKIQHLGDTKYKCGVAECGKLFPNNALLKRHVLAHK